MAGKNQHVVPHQDGWAVKGVCNQRATSVHDTQRQEIDAARDIARNQQSELGHPIARMVASATMIAMATICFLRKVEAP